MGKKFRIMSVTEYEKGLAEEAMFRSPERLRMGFKAEKKPRAKVIKIEYAAKVFQKYCVLCDCLKTTGTIDMCRCFTCNALVQRDRRLHGGHWKKRSNHSVILERANCNAQCYVCNVQQHGNMNVYEQKMIEKYGQEEHDRIVILAKKVKKWTSDELEPLVAFWRSEIKRMLEEKKL